MDAVLRAGAIYLILLALLRLAGRRTLAEMTSFDFVLVLVIGEATQQALLGEDFSMTNAVTVIVTLLGLDVGLSYLKVYVPKFSAVLDGKPMIVLENGRPITERLRMSRIDVEDILEAARSTRGLERLDQIRYAILEVNGGISVIPHRPHEAEADSGRSAE